MESYTVKYYQSINRTEKEQANALAIGIRKKYNPQSIIDIGCGPGLYLSPFTDIIHLGVDISFEAIDDKVRKISKDNFRVTNITLPTFTVPIKYDVALCLEVLEHIGMEHMEQTIKNLTSVSDRLIISIAQPGQAGLNHVTLQPYSYWEDLFKRNRFMRDYYDEYDLLLPISQVPHTIWIIRNLMVFKKI